MQQPVLRASGHLNARSKTGSNTSLGTTPPRVSAQQSREPSRQRNEEAQSVGEAGLAVESAKSTEALIRRVLCPLSQTSRQDTQPLHELLPPLTSSNEVDLQLYAIIAIVMRDFVYSWYGKITPDHSFVEEVISIIAHCTRDLEQRFRRVDLESLILDEIPALVGDHISGRCYTGTRELITHANYFGKLSAPPSLFNGRPMRRARRLSIILCFHIRRYRPLQ